MRLLNVVAGPAPRGRGISLGPVSPGVAAYRADSVDASGLVAGLIAELLLGSRDPRWSRSPWAPGEAHIAALHGELTLRRSGEPAAPRLALAPTTPRTADAPPPSPAEWQGDLPPAVLAAVFFAGPDTADPLRPLLSVEVAEAFTRVTRRRRAAPAGSGVRRDASSTEELLRRRDGLAAQIEALLGARREENAQLDRTLRELDAQRDSLAARLDEARLAERALSERLESDSARVRYEELSRVAAEAEGRQAADEWAPRVEELDEEVARWRATLAELESRESFVRGELAHLRPDDAAPQLLLADQRASIAVAQRLVADLEAEVARFARSPDSPACVCRDAHPRLNPLVDLLGRHVHRLAALVAAQDQALRTQEMLAEAAQLDRSQAELRRQLDHLLERRQTLHRSSRARSERTRDDAPLAAGFDRDGAQRRYAAVRDEAESLAAELADVERRRDDAFERRRRLLHADQLAQWQRELDAVQSELTHAVDRPALATAGSLRASDVLVRLTDGQLTELRLAPGGRTVEARDRSGHIVLQSDLPEATLRLVGWALRLALADAAHAGGTPFPLVLDQPFEDLDDRHAARLATCLDDYARRGRQVVVLAREGAGLARLRGLGVNVPPLGEESRPAFPSVAAPPVRVEAPQSEVVREEAVTRAWLLDPADPIGRFPVPLADRDRAFARSRVRTVGDLISSDPSAVAEEMAIDGVTPELVALWQAHAALVCFTPGLDLAGAKLLVDCDILSVDQLAGADAERLARALSQRGAPAALVSRAEEWVEGAADGVARWESSGFAEAWRQNRRERRERIRDNANRRAAGGDALRLRTEPTERVADRSRSDRGRGKKAEPGAKRKRSDRDDSPRKPRRDERGPRFYLTTGSPIADAPSVGPKRAEQLIALGIDSVARLLAADPTDLAARLADARVDAAAVVAWKHQAELMCRIAGLRGHDAQVLVGSGFTAPGEIAAMKPAELLEFVSPYCDSPEGQRVLRGAPRPDLTEVASWVEAARRRGAVGAA